MNGTLGLILLALFLRVLGSAARALPDRPLLRAVGWLLCTSAVWFAASAAGAWSPLAVALLLGLLGALIETQPNAFRHELWLGTDIGVILLSGLLSMPPITGIPLLAVTVLVASAGLMIDWLLVHYLKLEHLITVFLSFVLICWPPAMLL